MAKSSLRPLSADLAINLYEALLAARRLQLQPALGQAVSAIGVAIIDAQLQRLVPAEALDRLGGLGMRGERVFPVPAILRYAPPLIGYYRMLLGLSKKEFGDRLGYGPWRDAETLHVLPARLVPHLDDFCTALIAPLAELVAAMGSFDDRDLSDLTLLTLGPTLQGGRNNVIGALVARRVFEVLRALVAPGLALDDRRRIRFTTPHGRTFELLEGADPDIRLVAVSGEQTTPVVAIEIKGAVMPRMRSTVRAKRRNRTSRPGTQAILSDGRSWCWAM